MNNKVTKEFQAVLNPRGENLEIDSYAGLLDQFTSHEMNSTQISCANAIRQAGLLFAETIALNTPKCPDQTASIRKIREAVWTSVSAVAFNPKEYQDK